MTMRARAALSLLLASLAASAPASAQPTPSGQAQQEGRERFRRGIDLYRDGDFRGALIEFRRANEAAPSFRIQYNIGQTCLELLDYACALRAFERYLEGGEEVPKDRRATTEKELARLRKLVANVRIVANIDGAEVAIDDVVVGLTPLAGPVLVGAGRRRITVTKAPAIPSVRVVDVAGGDAIDMVFDLSLPAPPVAERAPAPPARAAPASPVRPRANTGAWIGLAATGVVGVGAAVTGALALGAKSDLDAAVGADPGDPAAIGDARTRTRTLATVTDVLLVSTAVLGAGTLVLFAAGSSSASASAPRWRLGLGAVSGTF